MFQDLDEVRIGILKHLADFLKLLNKNDRNEYLPRLEEFLKMDNERNWRFRLELTEQLGVLVPLFKPEDIRDHLAPIALTLVQVWSPMYGRNQYGHPWYARNQALYSEFGRTK